MSLDFMLCVCQRMSLDVMLCVIVCAWSDYVFARRMSMKLGLDMVWPGRTTLDMRVLLLKTRAC